MTSILDPKIHSRLIEELDDVARRAGIPKRYITESMTEHCTDEEVEWVKSFRDHANEGVFGLAYVGVDHASRMMAMCGALTRNFVLAEVVTLVTLLEQLRFGEVPDSTVLFVPSFHRTAKNGATSSQINLLWNLLEDRMINERLTVIGVQSLSGLKSDYGDHFEQLVRNHYRMLAK